MFAVEHYVTGVGAELSRRWWTDVDDGAIWVEYRLKTWPLPLFEVEELYGQTNKVWNRRLSPEFFEWVPEQ